MSDNNPATPAPARGSMDIENHEALGNLVKFWSTKDTKYTKGKAYPEPVTSEQLNAILKDLGAGASIPANRKVKLVRYEVDEVVLRIPPAALILEEEQSLMQPGTTYEIPPFYLERPIKGSLPTSTPDEKLLLQARRIGDYAISHCE